MTNVVSSTCALVHMFEGKMQEFYSEIQNVQMVWLEEIQQEANRMFSSDFSAEPELMPKTPSQKKSNRRIRVSLGRQEEARAKRRFSKGKRSNLRRSSVKTSLNLITEDEGTPKAATSNLFPEEHKRSTHRNKPTESEATVDAGPASEDETTQNSAQIKESEKPHDENPGKAMQEDIFNTETDLELPSCLPSASCESNVPPKAALLEAVVQISAADRLSAETVIKLEASPGRLATKITIAGTPSSSRRSSVRHSLTVRRSLAGLRHSMTQEAVRRASRRSFLKKKARMGTSTCSSNVSEDVSMETDGEEVVEKHDGALSEESPDAEMNTEGEATNPSPEEKEVVQDVPLPATRFTRSMAQNTPANTTPSSIIRKASDSGSEGRGKKPSSLSIIRSQQSSKRRAPDATGELQSPRKKPSPPKKSQTVIRPNMKSFLHTVQKNQLLMMTPSSLGRTSVMKSFIKHTTPAKIDTKLGSGVVGRERLKLEALKKKQEQEEERKKKIDDDKRRKQEDIKRKRDERLRRVVEARVKEEQKEEEKKKKIEQKMAQIDEKNDKLRFERLAEERAKKKIASKRQEELEQRRKVDEDARRKKIQEAEEEEKRQQELLLKRRAEEEQDRARKLAEARRALELKKEQEREKEREQERERLAAAERERVEKEKALVLQREVEKAAREKERRELEEKKKELERKRKEEERKLAEEKAAKEAAAAAAAAATTTTTAAASSKTVVSEVQHTVMKTPGKGVGLNVTVDIEQSPQSYEITPKGGNKPVVVNTNPDDYGMDQNSDDSTDDESAPRKPIPSWAEGHNLKQAMMKQYFNPVDLHAHFGEIEPPKLENIFYKSKPRYFKRTSSAVWHSPPRMGALPH